jgi:hypothetical protein
VNRGERERYSIHPHLPPTVKSERRGQNAVDQNGELVGVTDVVAQTRHVMADLVMPQ